jgi:hypothetical protein
MDEEKVLSCGFCGKYMGVLRDAKTRKGMVVLCSECAAKAESALRQPDITGDMPDFMRDLLRF